MGNNISIQQLFLNVNVNLNHEAISRTCFIKKRVIKWFYAQYNILIGGLAAIQYSR